MPSCNKSPIGYGPIGSWQLPDQIGPPSILVSTSLESLNVSQRARTGRVRHTESLNPKSETSPGQDSRHGSAFYFLLRAQSYRYWTLELRTNYFESVARSWFWIPKLLSLSTEEIMANDRQIVGAWIYAMFLISGEHILRKLPRWLHAAAMPTLPFVRLHIG